MKETGLAINIQPTPPMNLRHSLHSVAACLMFVGTATAQLMPHDNWRVSGVEFGSPTNNTLRSIAVGSGGVYVGEVNGGNPTQILQFTEAGAYVRRFSMDFGFIHGISCDAAGNVYVLSRGLTRVRVFDANGTYLREWGQWGQADGQFDLEGATGNAMIAVNSKTSEVFVCDPGNARVQVFTTTGTFLRKWGQAGSLPGQFQAGSPSAIVTADSGHVIVANSNGASEPGIKIFDTTGAYLRGANLSWANVNVYGIAISNDGLVAINHAYQNNIDYPPHMGDLLLDPGESYANIGGLPAIKFNYGGAFSKRGDFYSVAANRVAIAIREYSNASNFPAAPGIPHPMILSASQRAGANLVEVDYQVKDADSATVSTALLAVRDGDTKNRTGYSVPARTFVEGTATNIGADQPAEVTRHVVWNMPADWAIDYATFEFEILARDNRNLLGIHWITVPASGVDPAIQVSSAPITNPQLRDLWLWYLGNGLVNQTYATTGNGWLGTIWGKSGVYTGIKLSADYDHPWDFRTLPTPAGLVFAYEQIGAHPITPAELARAQAGRYGFSSVTTDSIVKNLGPTTSYLKGWGRNDYGQSSWQQFAAPNISKVAAGGNACTFFIRADGTLWAVGVNNYGQLGDGTTTARTGPIQIATGVTEVATGGSHSLFVKTDGSLWAMGLNTSGQLGDGTLINRTTPVQILPSGVSKVACGAEHSLLIKTDGKLYAMGRNSEGQLGDTTVIARDAPVLVTNGTGVAQVSAGMYHSLFVTTGGALYSTGYNNFGQLGDNGITARSTPFLVVAAGVAQASASTGDDQGHSVFVKTNGSLWAMGRNSHGQLGNGNNTNSSIPLQIVTSGVAQAHAGSLHTVFLKTDKTIWAMGCNNYSQLGDHTTTSRNTPAQFDVNATAIAVGGWHTLAITLP
jgi:alpha-tubulin suppressor-like RCC1 family protein